MAKPNLTLKPQPKPETQLKLADIVPDNEWERMNFKVKKSTYQKLKRYAFENDKSMTEVITNLIDTLDNR